MGLDGVTDDACTTRVIGLALGLHGSFCKYYGSTYKLYRLYEMQLIRTQRVPRKASITK